MENGLEILIEHSHKLKWMVSDQACEFDDFLRMPINDRARFAQAVRRYLEYRNGVPPETSLDSVLEKLRHELEELSRSGEDLDRLARWLLSMLDTGQNSDQIKLARSSWVEGLNYWRSNGLPAATLLKYPLTMECVNSYTREVSIPFQEFRERSEKSEKNWMKSKDSRSHVDNVLFEFFYEEANCSPINDFHILVAVALERTWFEKAKNIYSEEIFDELYQLLVPLAYSGEHLSADPKYVHLAPLHEAFALNEGYSFIKYCRDNAEASDADAGF